MSFARRMICFASFAWLAAPVWAEDSVLKPLPEGWWHLSLDEIRAGESNNNPSFGNASQPTATPQLDLKEWAKQNHQNRVIGASYETRKPGLSEIMLRKNFKLEEFIATQPENDNSRKANRGDNSAKSVRDTGSSTDTTLRDYTTATTRALQQGTQGTNVFRPLSTTMPVSSIDFGLYNRTQPKQDTENSSAPETSGITKPVLPGPSSYDVPSSPLSVVQSSLADPQFKSLPNPYPVGEAPSTSTTPTPAIAPAKSADATASVATNQPPAQQSTLPPVALGSATKPAASSAPVIPPLPFQPVIPRRGGPNKDGFYEPKSIRDLQMGR